MDAEFPLSSEPIEIYIHNDTMYTFNEKGEKVPVQEYVPPELLKYAWNKERKVPE